MKLVDLLIPFSSDIDFELYLNDALNNRIGTFTKMDKGLNNWLKYEVKYIELVIDRLFITIGGKDETI